MTDKIAKAGSLLCVDSGEYSDYSVTGFFVVLRDFEPDAELREYLDKNPKQEGYGFSDDQFLAKLLAKGLLLEIEYGQLYMGSYMTCSNFRFNPAKTA